MRTISLHKERLLETFKKYKITKIKRLKNALGSNSSGTIFRKLKKINYLSSCSHSGKYYTLNTTPKFNELGLWHYKSVLFFLHGTLFETIKNLIEVSENGYSALELEKLLKVKPNEVLLNLINKKLIFRQKMEGKYIYFSSHKNDRIRQELSRKRINAEEFDFKKMTPDVLMNEVKAAIILFYCTLNEKQRRLYAGLESLKSGGGSEHIISDLLNLNVKTIRKGREELLSNSINVDTVRNSGGGRKKKKRLSRT